MNRRTAVLAVLASLAALPSVAWEPTASGVDKRLRRLEAAMQSASSARSKTVIAEQDPPPSWIQRDAWKETFGGQDYFFGVGESRGIENPALAVVAAEDRARAQLLKLVGQPVRETTGQTAAAAIPGAQPVDWYRDKADGSFRALVVLRRPSTERARMSP